MRTTAIIAAEDAARPDVEDFIRGIYREHYGASVDNFPSQLISMSDGDRIVCAAGLRTERDGFFSEHYLDAPIDTILSGYSDRSVKRAEILEISTLASRAPAEIPRFISSLIAFGKSNRFAWSFFTATARLQRIVVRLGLSPIYLAEADRTRIAGFERWGDYYATTPRVFAVTGPQLSVKRRPPRDFRAMRSLFDSMMRHARAAGALAP